MANVTIKQVCKEMGIAPISGSYERALANFMGITTQVNGSWIQAMAPTIQSMKDQLENGTYPGIGNFAETFYQFNIDIAVDGMLFYAHENGYDGYRRSGVYVYTVLDYYVWQPSYLITWLTDEFCELFKVNNTTEVQQQAITTMQAIVSEPTFNNSPSVTLNTSNLVSTTKKTRMSYTVSVTTNLNLLNLTGGGQVHLETSPNGITWTRINSVGSTRTLTLGVSVGIAETQVYNLQGELPKGHYRRLTTELIGGATAAYVRGQEVYY